MNKKLVGKTGLSRFVEWSLVALLIIIPLLLISLPWSITLFTERTPDDPEGFYQRYFVILSYSAVMVELMIWQGRGVLHNVNGGKIFCTDTVRRMRVMAVECVVLAVFYFATMFWMSKFFMAVLFVAFVLIGCSLLVFAELFRQANLYKEENDMTI